MYRYKEINKYIYLYICMHIYIHIIGLYNCVNIWQLFNKDKDCIFEIS